MPHWAPTLLELVGTTVTAYGLLFAYGRDQGLPPRVRRVWDWLRRKRPETQTIGPTGIPSGEIFGGRPDARIGLNIDPQTAVADQLAQIVAYVRELRLMIGPLQAQIDNVGRAVEEAKKHAETAAAQALAHAIARMEENEKRRSESQAADLSIAALGVAITGAGVFLGFWGP
ncbi:hypothetical protein ACNQVK_27510 [Mycobacterium sp. 134]|uniref:hypothetical protein n=1 Tax=Mycobacterium sp. 134 TaxID=3400425 RepID=UPI003AAEB709